MLQDDANTTMTRLARTVFKRSNSACWFVAVLLASVATRAAGPYESRWESLDKRPMPGWFNEAKFGVFICWGPYSVPSWAPIGTYAEWYGHDAQKGSPTYQFHLKNYGADFKYEQFGPMLKGELWDPDSWAGPHRAILRQVRRLDRELPRRLLQLAQPVPQRLEQRGSGPKTRRVG